MVLRIFVLKIMQVFWLKAFTFDIKCITIYSVHDFLNSEVI